MFLLSKNLNFSTARLDDGCRSLRDNATDFEKADVSPRNSAATALTCDRWRLTESTALFYDGWELNAEADAQTGSITTIYLHGANTDEIIARADIANANAPNAVVYYTYDHLGSVRALSNTAGNIVESYQYEAFGKPTVFDASGNKIARSAFGNRFMFTGREYLGTIQLYDYRNRTYSPKWGRFIEVDPIRFEGRDLNLYRYVRNWVMELIDPWGLVPGDIFATPEEAAADAFNYIPFDPQGEYAGFIYKNGDGYSATYPGTRNDPLRSNAGDSVMPNGEAPTDEQIYACYHAHVLPGDNEFSEQDKRSADNTGLPEILREGDGNLTVYVPEPSFVISEIEMQ